MRRAVGAVCLVIVAGCGTVDFTPQAYPLRDGVIPPFDYAGEVTITNAQPATDEVLVYNYMGSKLASNLNAITAVMVGQAKWELKKNGKALSGTAKTMALEVDSLLSVYQAFFWKSQMHFHVTLGNGEVIEMNVPHSSGVLSQDLNGCIAEGVIALFNDARVKAYLAG